MDQATLVEEEIADGKRVLVRFGEAGIPVTAAAWILECDTGRWYLYIVSPVVEGQGIRATYRRVLSVFDQLPQPLSFGPFKVRAFGPRESVAQAILDLQRRHPGRSFIHFGGSHLGEREIEAVYLYPPAGASGQQDGQTSAAN